MAETGPTAGAAEPDTTRTSPSGRAEGRSHTREIARLTREIRSFAAAHGGSAEGQLSYLGARGFRLVLVGADGGWGDLVASRQDAAVRAAEEAGVSLHDSFDGELAARVRTGPYEWTRMAGMQIGGPRNT